ncbi:MAG: ExeM/NucH family extracellular endonuclease [Leptolyngbyaceae cyanobacterium]
MATDLFISEYVEGSSFNKAIEIFNGTGAAIDLEAGGYTLEVYFNGASSPNQTLNLTGTIADGDVFVLAHGSADASILAEADVQNSFVINFNGDDTIVLRKNGVVIDALGQIGTDPGSSWPGGGANVTLRRQSSITAGDSDADNAFDASTEWDRFASDTFTGLGSHTVATSPITKIHGIQGNTDTSALVGQTVTIEAIVVGDFQDGDSDTGRNLSGFYVQEEDPDADGSVLTSEGIFIFEGGNTTTDVNLGDLVQITGTVAESFGETRLDTLTDITVISSGNTLPTPATVSLPTATTSISQDGDFQPDLEAFEGMRVTFDQPLTITEMFQLDRFNEIKLSQGGRLEQFTQTNAPDVAGYAAHLESIGDRTITYDDGLSEQNAAIGNLDGFGPSFSTLTDIRMGDTLDDLSGVLSYQWAGNAASGATWRVRSTVDGENTFTKANPRSEEPDEVGGTLKVASLNVLNFFATLDENGNRTANNNDPRGADNAVEFGRQLDKLVSTLQAMDADVVGLVELENDFLDTSPGNAIKQLVDQLNVVIGTDIYDWVKPGPQFVGDDAIAVGFIYKPDTVGLVGNAAILESNDFLDPNNTGESRNRAALAQTFEETNTGETFTAVINHFKSKGDSGLDNDNDGVPDNPADPDNDQLDGQGYWNDTRTKAAQALADWLETDPTGSGDSDFLILGDLNAYAKEDPITTLESEGYTNLAATFVGSASRSFVFEGQTGTLDYSLANASLLAQVTGATEWHINADEPDAIDYNTDFNRDVSIFNGGVPYRSSDHDPLVIGLALGRSSFIITETNDDTVVDESGLTDTFTVVLDRRPTTNVELTITSADTDEVTVSAAQLLFTPDDWNNPQTVTVTGVDDGIADTDQIVDVTVGVDKAVSDGSFDAVPDQTVSVTNIECFVTGTHILTPNGDVPVETLNIGDRVLTAAGEAVPIKWIGRQTVEPAQVVNPLRGYPILVKAGALGHQQPQRDLYVSPDHALLFEGLLINAGALVNHCSILKTTPTEPFTYYHIQLHQHSLLVAEGTAAESYLPQTENRSWYDNGADYALLYPHDDILTYWPMRYPRVSSKRQLPRFIAKKLMQLDQMNSINVLGQVG